MLGVVGRVLLREVLLGRVGDASIVNLWLPSHGGETQRKSCFFG